MQTDLPEEIITNILSRLPARSAACFQSVCKQWLSCINDPFFLSGRRRCRSSNTSLNNIRFVCRYIADKRIDLYNYDRESNKHHLSSFYINPGSSPRYYLSNTVNGLTCAFGPERSDVHMLELDKLEAQRSELPRCRRRESKTVFDINKVGLGFDSLKRVYKVVRLFTLDTMNYSCEILSVGSRRDEQWREIGEAPAADYMYGPVFLHGALHWKPRAKKGLEDPLTLIRFDVESEKFEIMEPMPHNSVWDSGFLQPKCFMGFAELENSICGLFCTSFFKMDIWILKNYKTCEWIKILKINLSNKPYFPPSLITNIEDGIIMLKVWGMGTREWVFFDIGDEVYHNLLRGA